MAQNLHNIENNIFHIGICDDEPLAIDYLTTYLNKWAENKNCALRLSTFNSAEQFLFEYEENKDFDILFLDIQMGNMNGMELARKIRTENQKVQIVFITAIADFMAEGYEVSALHYLIKPVNEDKLFAVMDRAVENIGNTERFVVLTVEQTVLRIPVNSIISVEAFAHYINVITSAESYQLRENISSLAERLGEEFVRPHRSYLVNLRHIHSISKTEVLLDNGTAIPLSRYNYQKINQAFIQYYKGQIDHGIF